MRNYNFLMITAVLFPFAAYADTCPPLEPQDYLVFSQSDINSVSTDFNGAVGAQGSIRLNRFTLGGQDGLTCTAAVAGKSFSLQQGTVFGGVDSPSSSIGSLANLYGVTAHASPNLSRLSDAAKYFKDESNTLAQLPVTQTAQHTKESTGDWTTVTANSPVTVVSLKSGDVNGYNLRFKGTPDQTIIVNIDASDHQGEAELVGKDFALDGISPSHLILNFRNTSQLRIEKDGSSQPYDSHSTVGIGATILAPGASFSGGSAHITGGLYVGRLSGSVQVNYAPTAWPDTVPLPSIPAPVPLPSVPSPSAPMCPLPIQSSVDACATLKGAYAILLASQQPGACGCDIGGELSQLKAQVDEACANSSSSN